MLTQQARDTEKPMPWLHSESQSQETRPADKVSSSQRAGRPGNEPRAQSKSESRRKPIFYFKAVLVKLSIEMKKKNQLGKTINFTKSKNPNSNLI